VGVFPRAIAFPAFFHPRWDHLFFLREPEACTLEQLLDRAKWSQSPVLAGEQTHGREVAWIDSYIDSGVIPSVDAVATDVPGLTLAVRVADCAPVYLGDPVTGTLALIHSGRRGTGENIFQATVDVICRKTKAQTGDLRCLIGPCIRPPDYEMDIAAQIRNQAAAAGIRHVSDCGLNTASDLSTYYSYRKEKGKTGRHWAVARLTSGSAVSSGGT